MKSSLWNTLYSLAQLGASQRSVRISTTQLARVMNGSQQTASRQLIQLEGTGLVERHFNVNGGSIRITEKGMDELRRVYLNLKAVIEGATPTLKLVGTVFKGLQEGAYYVSQRGYRHQFVEKIGFDPYPGTLNIKLNSKADLQAYKELGSYPAILIEGFEDEHRSFGPLRCYKAMIKGRVQGALIMIQRTHHDSSVVELIAPLRLRDQLGLKDRDKVEVEAFITEPAGRAYEEPQIKPPNDLKEQLRNLLLTQIRNGSASSHALAEETGGRSETWAKTLSNLQRENLIHPLEPKTTPPERATETKYVLTKKGRSILKVVLTGGVFDIIHTGHIRTLEEARRLGDILVAIVARNETVQRLKNRKPINDEETRLKVVSSLKPVDIALLGDAQNSYKVVRMVEPDIITLGYDQKEDEKTMQKELDGMGLGTRVVRLSSYVPGVKTSRIISLIREDQPGSTEGRDRSRL